MLGLSAEVVVAHEVDERHGGRVQQVQADAHLAEDLQAQRLHALHQVRQGLQGAQHDEGHDAHHAHRGHDEEDPGHPRALHVHRRAGALADPGALLHAGLEGHPGGVHPGGRPAGAGGGGGGAGGPAEPAAAAAAAGTGRGELTGLFGPAGARGVLRHEAVLPRVLSPRRADSLPARGGFSPADPNEHEDVEHRHGHDGEDEDD